MSDSLLKHYFFTRILETDPIKIIKWILIVIASIAVWIVFINIFGTIVQAFIWIHVGFAGILLLCIVFYVKTSFKYQKELEENIDVSEIPDLVIWIKIFLNTIRGYLYFVGGTVLGIIVIIYLTGKFLKKLDEEIEKERERNERRRLNEGRQLTER